MWSLFTYPHPRQAGGFFLSFLFLHIRKIFCGVLLVHSWLDFSRRLTGGCGVYESFFLFLHRFFCFDVSKFHILFSPLCVLGIFGVQVELSSCSS